MCARDDSKNGNVCFRYKFMFIKIMPPYHVGAIIEKEGSFNLFLFIQQAPLLWLQCQDLFHPPSTTQLNVKIKLKKGIK